MLENIDSAMSEKLALDGEVHELKLGHSFESNGTLAYHSVYCEYRLLLFRRRDNDNHCHNMQPY